MKFAIFFCQCFFLAKRFSIAREIYFQYFRFFRVSITNHNSAFKAFKLKPSYNLFSKKEILLFLPLNHSLFIKICQIEFFSKSKQLYFLI